jgi:hypothetical protein
MGILAEAMRMRFSRDVVSPNAVTFPEPEAEWTL